MEVVMQRALIATAALLAMTTTAMADVCYEIRLAKHQIYREAGLCFKDRNMIRHFGNAGCSSDYYGETSFPPVQWRRLRALRERSLSLGCGPGG